MTLRNGAKFTDGTPVTIDDVIWSLHRNIKLGLTGASIWRTFGVNAQNMETAMRADGDRLIVTPPAPTDPRLLLVMFAKPDLASIINSKVAKQHETNNDMAAGWLNTNTAGSGPFKLRSWKSNEIAILDRFEGYWAGEPKMKRVLVRHMPEPQTKRLMLEKGDLDVGIALAASDIEALKSNKSLNVQSTEGAGIYYVAVNMKDEKLANPKVREAIRDLIDYKGLNTAIMPNYGVQHEWLVPAGLPASLPNPPSTYDPAKAKSLLAEAGYPDGFEVELLALNEAPFQEVAAALQSSFAQAGIKAKIVTGSGNQIYGKMRERKYQMIVGRGGAADPHPHWNLRALLINPNNADDAGLGGVIAWRTAYQSEELNKLAIQALVEKDAAKQVQLYKDLQKRWYDLVPALMPFSLVVDTSVVSKDVQGYRDHYGFTTRFDGVTKAR
jgi:peptide/nickel transport system substrate-binding protein